MYYLYACDVRSLGKILSRGLAGGVRSSRRCHVPRQTDRVSGATQRGRNANLCTCLHTCAYGMYNIWIKTCLLWWIVCLSVKFVYNNPRRRLIAVDSYCIMYNPRSPLLTNLPLLFVQVRSGIFWWSLRFLIATTWGSSFQWLSYF